jgi:outer membrane lipoprotein-sorting protein
MTRITAIFITFLFIFLQSAAQDIKANKILEELKEKTRSYLTIQAEFTYSVTNPQQDLNESFNGVLYIKGDSYRLSLAGQLVICDGETTWTYIEDAQEVQINSVEEEDESLTPSKIFNSVFDDYTSQFTGEYNQDGRILQKIELTPVENKSFSKIILEIDKFKLEIVQLAVSDKSGNRYSYKITRFNTGMPIGDDKFTFNINAFPDAEIIDMR